MEPRRVMIVEPIALQDGHLLQKWTYVWKLGERDGKLQIEYRDREYSIPASCAVDTPVPAPSPEKLLSLDPCFSDLGNLQEVYRNDRYMFIVYRCPHGNFFLEDTRGGIAMYPASIFLGQVEDTGEANLKHIWSKHHDLPTDAIHYLGIGR